MLKSTTTTPQGVDVSKPYDLAVVIGRFQLPHAGHALLFNRASELAHNVLIVKGSAFQPRTPKNPFKFEELGNVISRYFSGMENPVPSHVVPQTDSVYNDPAWLKRVQSQIEFRAKQIMDRYAEGTPARICIVGNKKDETSFYLDMFPQYASEMVAEFKLNLDSTTLRRLFLTNPESMKAGEHLLLPPMVPFLRDFMKTPEYEVLVKERAYYDEYPTLWGKGPHVTVDSVVIKAGHILLIKRGDFPGAGLWALPGGFLEGFETLYAGAVRELDEETNIDIPPAVLKGSLVKYKEYSAVGRSQRGRVITFAHHFDLDGHDKKPGLPKVKASSDAKEVEWVPLNEFFNMSDVTFEDHQDIVKDILGIE